MLCGKVLMEYHLGSMNTDTDSDTDSAMDRGHDVCKKIRTQTWQGHGKNININI